MLSGNEKRKASCKAVGGAKKRGGHALEHLHDSIVGVKCETTSTKAEADCHISAENPRGAELLSELEAKFGEKLQYCSVKSGNNLQFVLGNIPEIVEVMEPDAKLAAIKEPALWKKYLGKAQSAKPADLLVYYHSTKKSWTYFKMAAVIAFIVEAATWRILSTGRIKGDFQNGSAKGFSQYLTYEYRQTHKSHFLGANGGKGLPFVELLKAKLPHVEKTY
jgi:hypothetical protein